MGLREWWKLYRIYFQIQEAAMNGKVWYLSKTIWVNIAAVIGILIAKYTGIDALSTEVEAAILAVVNIVLRIITTEPVTLTK